TAGCVGRLNIIWVYPGQPLATRYFGCPFRKAVDGSIPFRNLHFFRIHAVREAADESRLARELQLHCPFAQSQLSPLPLTDVASETFDSQEAPSGVELTLCRLLQPHVITVGPDKAESYGIRGIVGSE